MYFHFITRPPRSPPGTNVEWCKIKAQIDCYIQSNNCRKIPICSPTLKPHEVRLYEFFSQTKIHLFVFENTVDLLCKPLSLDLVPLYRAENSAGTGFHSPPPRYHEKDIHSSNYPLPLRSSRKKKKKTQSPPLSMKLQRRGSKPWQGRNLIALTPTNTLFNVLKKKNWRRGMPRDGKETGMTGKMLLSDIFSIQHF